MVLHSPHQLRSMSKRINTDTQANHGVQPPQLSPAFSPASCSSPSSLPLRKVLIELIPTSQCTQKHLADPLRCLNIQAPKVSIFRNGKALVESADPDLSSKMAKFHEKFGHPVKVTDQNPKSFYPFKPPVKRSWSVVMKGVELNVSMDEIREAANRAGIQVSNLWRIRSRATDKMTTLVRIITTDARSSDQLLRCGLSVFLENTFYRCEASHPSKPRLSQCTRCLKLGHTSASCFVPSKCSTCTQPLLQGHTCPAVTPACLNCGGKDHPTYSIKCPAKIVAPDVPLGATAILSTSDSMNSSSDSIRESIRDITELSDLVPQLVPYSRQIVKFTSVLLLNLFPQNRPLVQQLISELSLRFFNHETSFNYSGDTVHVTCRRPL